MNAFLEGLNQAAAVGLAALLNTLWYAAGVVALTWMVLRFSRRVNAATRYWIWTAVLGFLVVLPFLPALVAQVEAAKSVSPAAVAPLATVTAAPQAVQHLAPVTLTLSSAPGSNPWPLWLMMVWIAVAAWQLLRLVRAASSVRGLKARSEKASAIALPVELSRRVQALASGEITSPVAVGFRHPAVIVPTGLLSSLEESERKNVLLHELAHLARYDDWLNLLTRAVGAFLSLHPLAGIVLKQIEREREMACDDFVVAHTGSARSYARSLARLHDLRSTEGTRLLAPALLGGKVSLADRIESLLRRGRKFSTRPSLANLGVSAFLLILLLGAGGLMPSWVAIAQTSPDLKSVCADLPKNFCADLPNKFEVASVKPSKAGLRGSNFSGRPGRIRYTNVRLDQLILQAYNLRPEQLEGVPSWTKSHRYTIIAEAPPSMAAAFEMFRKMPPDQQEQAVLAYRESLGQMLQSLLADRFSLKVHRATKRLPVYELLVTKGGPKLKPENAADFLEAHRKPGSGTLIRMRAGSPEAQVTALGASTSALAGILSRRLERLVIDKTGLKGRYDFTLKWSPRFDRMNEMDFGSGTRRPAPNNPSGPSIFTALQEQLGLKLKPAKGPVQVLVVDHISPPTPN